MITTSARITRGDDLVSAAVGEDLVMMDVVSGKFFLFDEIGSYVWVRLAAPAKVEELLADLLERYDVSREQCTTDVLALLERMRAMGLVRVGE